MKRAIHLLCAILLTAIAAVAGAPVIALDTSVPSLASPQGIWEVPGGAVFEIMAAPAQTGVYTISVIAAPGTDIPCHTLAGTMRAGAGAHTFDAALHVDPRHHAKQKTRNFILEFNETFDTVVFKPYNTSWRINVARLLPYFFRLSVERPADKPAGADAAFRISPEAVVNL